MTTSYTAGTVTLTNGSAVITGIGTAWQTALIAGGILIAEADGNPLPILSVDSNTQITAAIKWKGASGTYPYAIMRDTAYGQQTVANAQALATYLTRLDTATLSALNALGPSMLADKVPYATSNAAMAWATFTSYGRTLVAATTDATFATAAKVVRRSGGANMGASNDVMLGWHSTEGQLIAQIDAVQLGKVWTDYYATTVGAADIRSKIGAFSASGGTVSGSVHATGNLSSMGSVTGNLIYNISAANADGALYFQTGVVAGATYNRWAWVKRGFGIGEPGGNVGADMALMRWGDANQYLGTSMVAERKSGAVHTPETPLLCTNMGADITIAGGNTLVGVSEGGFLFNRGGFSLGGSLNGRNAVHVPLDGWYLISMFIAGSVQGAGVQTAVELLRNGTGVLGALVLGPGYMTQTMTILTRMSPNDWFAYRVSSNPFLFTGWNTRLTAQWLHP
ncbi:hypothetical protein PWG15_12520 [Ensifer adhaerens]|uniref:hypothetical protein n=1 Tax=Ensifer adhaerens TaxID=106592 RepID=UPI0023A9F758|nr:hypothetical protein [Ensifer adhaerens]WDZ75441.1 hypothetical protein PWG15_12520 [Ensifer adhaerens]